LSAEITHVNKIRKILTWKRLSNKIWEESISIVSDFLVFYGPEAAKVLVAMQ
jgi:hypothetical protein